ncbi:MAG: FAD-dependent oxidoreductase [Acidimicrobiia bacterium]|nr:FAD-dependent oxidoreductase [Acidimicrobiia bacterium]MDH4307291.1 FAD-dependent oxidoreductase [Acidimicrobiia bacterium]MDH5294899.1 FAD-dependent oxidoreductase [Acidimicrobiia bacterium]
MSNRYDVVVVGARVAGAMTALHLARQGLEVLIVDRAGPPADTVSTHALMRTGVLQLERAGLLQAVSASTPAVRRITLGFGTEPFTFDVKPEFGVGALYAPRRTLLDPVVLDAASSAGADVRLGASVVGLSRDRAGRVDGVTVRSGSSTSTIGAGVVVGADGRNSTIARLVDAPLERSYRASSALVYTYFEGIPDVGYDFRFSPGMSTSAVSTNGGVLLAATVAAHAFDEPAATFERVFRSTAPDLAEAAAGARRVERYRFTPGIASFLRVPTGPGWVLVGDAGFTKDPLSAHGISCAFRDAELAAIAASASVADPATEAQAGWQYRSTRNRFAIPILENTVELASYRWDTHRASELMRELGRITDEECAFLTSRADRLVA